MSPKKKAHERQHQRKYSDYAKMTPRPTGLLFYAVVGVVGVVIVGGMCRVSVGGVGLRVRMCGVWWC